MRATIYGGEPPHNVNDHASATAAGILATAANTAVSLGSNIGRYFSESQLLILLGPDQARTIADDGSISADVQRVVLEHARLPIRTEGSLATACGNPGLGRRGSRRSRRRRAPALDPLLDDVFVFAARGPGKH